MRLEGKVAIISGFEQQSAGVCNCLHKFRCEQWRTGGAF